MGELGCEAGGVNLHMLEIGLVRWGWEDGVVDPLRPMWYVVVVGGCVYRGEVMERGQFQNSHCCNVDFGQLQWGRAPLGFRVWERKPGRRAPPRDEAHVRLEAERELLE